MWYRILYDPSFHTALIDEIISRNIGEPADYPVSLIEETLANLTAYEERPP